jgi:hypothetical protein
MKNIRKYTAVFLIGFILGALWYRLRLFPIPELDHYKTHIMPVTIYKTGTNFFNDRDYIDSLANPELEGMQLIQLNRHRHQEDLIVLNIKTPITIYRAISKLNNNDFLHSYTQTNLTINVEGPSSSHTSIVKKDFSPGIIALSPGSGLSSSPIFLSSEVKNMPQNKIFSFVADFNCDLGR